jgi:hypothetical protein
MIIEAQPWRNRGNPPLHVKKCAIMTNARRAASARRPRPASPAAPVDRDRSSRRGTAMTASAGEILTLLRQHDIPCSIDHFGATGWSAKLGDPARGFYAQQARFPTFEAAARWLLDEARRQYPDVVGRAARRSRRSGG